MRESSGSVVLDAVLDALELNDGGLRELAANAGLSYDWVLKVKQRVIKSPGVVQVEELYRALYGESPDVGPSRGRAA